MQVEELTREALAEATGAEVRHAIRTRRWRGTTHDMARGRIQANLAILPASHALDFLRFCLRNRSPARCWM